MAIIKRDEVVFGGNCKIPQGVYTVRINKAEKGMSKAQKPKVVLSFEIISPEQVEFAGAKYGIAGRKFTVHQPMQRDESWGASKLFAALDKSKFDYYTMNDEGEFDDDKLHKLVGHTMLMVLDSEPNTKRFALTEEDISAGLTQGKPMLDGEGKEISLGWSINANLDNVVGPGIPSVQPY